MMAWKIVDLNVEEVIRGRYVPVTEMLEMLEADGWEVVSILLPGKAFLRRIEAPENILPLMPAAKPEPPKTQTQIAEGLAKLKGKK